VTPQRRTRDTLTVRLRRAGCVAAEEEAAELIAAAAGGTPLESLVRRREAGEPLAWITGTVSFCGHAVAVDPGVYVPRPQSEELARRAAAELSTRGAVRAADLCTGSGAIAVELMAMAPDATVVALDADLAAVRCARRNGVRAVVGDLRAPFRAAAFDVVTAVAPYVPTRELAYLPADVLRHEPVRALDGGADGLDVVRRVVAAAAVLLVRGGWLFTEIGGEQESGIAPTLDACGFEASTAWFDDDGDLRGVAARRTAD
jgi:release factor glutamine methyltransferase